MLATFGKGDVLLADNTYDSDAHRLETVARPCLANIKLMPNLVRASSPLI